MATKTKTFSRKTTTVKRGKMTAKVHRYLTNFKGTTMTYAELAKKMKTNARAVGQALRSIGMKYGKEGKTLTMKVTYGANTRPKTYAKR
jgi:hypothetical protein